jgi:hypothetical protein
MSENMNELHELEELKTTYNLMDERLDGQEIVSNEQIRDAMYRKFTDMRQNIKENLIWGNLIFVPVLAWWAWANSRLTLLGIILLSVYWVASLIFRFVILRQTKKEDYGSYDLKTLVERESQYSKNIKWGSIVTFLVLTVFFLQMFIGRARSELLIFIILALTLMIPILIRWLVIKLKYNGKAIDSATGKPRRLGGKWSAIVGYTLFGLAGGLFLVGTVMNLIDSADIGWLALLKILNGVAFIMSTAIFLLGSLHHKGKINISYRLLVILAVIAIALAVSVAGIATLMDITELTQSGFLLTTVAISGIGLSFYKMRK